MGKFSSPVDVQAEIERPLGIIYMEIKFPIDK